MMEGIYGTKKETEAEVVRLVRWPLKPSVHGIGASSFPQCLFPLCLLGPERHEKGYE